MKEKLEKFHLFLKEEANVYVSPYGKMSEYDADNAKREMAKEILERFEEYVIKPK